MFLAMLTTVAHIILHIHLLHIFVPQLVTLHIQTLFAFVLPETSAMLEKMFTMFLDSNETFVLCHLSILCT